MTQQMRLGFFALITVLAMAPTNSMSQADCSAELASIDARIASGKYPDYNVQLAKQMRASLAQMCGLMDESTRAAMFEGFEEILPTKSDAERQADRRARSEELKAARDALKQAEAARPLPADNEVLSAPPTARSIAATFIDRPDDMYHMWAWDWDTFEGKLRVLYSAFPDRVQFALPDWRLYVYVAEIAADGSSEQHMLTSRQASDHAALALRRGHDEILFERRIDRPGEVSSLEHWSISGQKLLSSSPAPNPSWPDHKPWDWGPFRLATSDGNVFYSATRKTADGVSTIAWFEASPEGRLLGRGSVSSSTEDIGSDAFFVTQNGGGGLIMSVRSRGDAGLQSSAAAPLASEIAGRKVRASVFNETRLLVTSNDGVTAWESPALERMLIWNGDTAIPKDLPVAEKMQQQREYMELTNRVNRQLNADRTIDTLDVGPHRVSMISATDDGFGILATVTADRGLVPPVHGPYLLRMDERGLRDETRLTPLAEQLGLKFTILAAGEDGEFYLFGKNLDDGSDYVLLLDAQDQPIAYGKASHTGTTNIDGMLSDAGGVWLFGHAYPDKRGARLWIERIDFH